MLKRRFKVLFSDVRPRHDMLFNIEGILKLPVHFNWQWSNHLENIWTLVSVYRKKRASLKRLCQDRLHSKTHHLTIYTPQCIPCFEKPVCWSVFSHIGLWLSITFNKQEWDFLLLMKVVNLLMPRHVYKSLQVFWHSRVSLKVRNMSIFNGINYHLQQLILNYKVYMVLCIRHIWFI